MFAIYADVDGVVRKFQTSANTAEDLSKPLAHFGAYLRKQAVARWEAQAFEPLAAGTLEKRAQRGVRRMEHKLHQDLKKAIGRAKAGQPTGGLLARLLGVPASDPSATAKSRGVQNRLAVLAEFQRQHRPGGSLAARADLKPLTLKQVASLGARTDRALSKAVGAKILGNRFPASLKVEVDGSTVSLESRSHGKFTEVHNAGGTAGHGAKIPKRETVLVAERDLDVLGEILAEHALAVFEE